MPGGPWHLPPAGFWYVFVSIPVVQFLLLRWYLRLFIWFDFFGTSPESTLNSFRLTLIAPLVSASWARVLTPLVRSFLLAGLVASRVLYWGGSLLSFKLQVAGFITFFVLAILGPILMFTPQMARAKRKGSAEYALLAQRYVESFEQKWVFRRSGQFRRTSRSYRYLVARRSRQQLYPCARNAFGPLRTRGYLPSGRRHRSSSLASLAHDFFSGGADPSHHQDRVLKISGPARSGQSRLLVAKYRAHDGVLS